MTRRVVGVLACHNRRNKTLACLESLFADSIPGVDVSAIVMDDGSTDGTAEAIRAAFSSARVLRGAGSLFWNGGMRAALAEAASADPEFYLWLNDDTMLDRGALAVLLDAHDRVASDAPAIVVGSVCDPAGGALTYGGVVRSDPRRPMRFELVHPGVEPRECHTMNGNCVLVSREAMLRVGNLEDLYVHAMGDYDYGLRARRQGCRIWVAPGTIGKCARNPETRPDTLMDAWRDLTGRKGLPPEEWREFTRRWAGPTWPLWFLSPYVRRMAQVVVRRVTAREAR